VKNARLYGTKGMRELELRANSNGGGRSGLRATEKSLDLRSNKVESRRTWACAKNQNVRQTRLEGNEEEERSGRVKRQRDRREGGKIAKLHEQGSENR